MIISVTAIITCAGKGERAGFGYNKLLKDMGGITPFEKVVSTFTKNASIFDIIVTCAEQDLEIFKSKCDGLGAKVTFVTGGATRTESVGNALKLVPDENLVLVHDGARAFITDEIISECVKTALVKGSAVTAIPTTDTIAETDGNGYIISTSRKNKYSVQTPQAFNAGLLKKAYSMIKDGEEFTDESGLYAKYIEKPYITQGSPVNKKLTHPEDFAVSENLYVGTGFDLHVFAENRKLILGGIEIPHDKGLLGHSDADVLTHAVMDAMLSSASLGDIGRHFPDTDPTYKGISSMKLLEKVVEILKKSGYRLKNVSSVIMAQKPKLANFVDSIRHNLALALGVDDADVGITCTTLEGIGTVGREEGIAVQSYCLTVKEN
ncbi:MAG: 2-C-methyl-D-erythritol 2,4-cyclodiphosphate synthase [Clostridia bacterium]|nr:2-C-methyl-D-erythritol 2,4-cyclodiphosphate synthase [Clostridia bacterium]